MSNKTVSIETELSACGDAHLNADIADFDGVAVEITTTQFEKLRGAKQLHSSGDVSYVSVDVEPNLILMERETDTGRLIPVHCESMGNDFNRVFYNCEAKVFKGEMVQFIWLPKEGAGEAWVEINYSDIEALFAEPETMKPISVKFTATMSTDLEYNTTVAVPSHLQGKELQDYLVAHGREIDGDAYTVLTTGDWGFGDAHVDTERTHSEALKLIGDLDNLTESREDTKCYVESYAMASHETNGDHLHDRHNGDTGEPDYYDFVVRSEVLSETVNGEGVYKEVSDVPVALSVEVGQLLADLYECELNEANN